MDNLGHPDLHMAHSAGPMIIMIIMMMIITVMLMMIMIIMINIVVVIIIMCVITRTSTWRTARAPVAPRNAAALETRGPSARRTEVSCLCKSEGLLGPPYLGAPS